MITNNEFKLLQDGDKYLVTYVNILEEIAYQGFSKFTVSDEYDFFRLYELFTDHEFDVRYDFKRYELEIKLK